MGVLEEELVEFKVKLKQLPNNPRAVTVEKFE
jgi:hypothetical protein